MTYSVQSDSPYVTKRESDQAPATGGGTQGRTLHVDATAPKVTISGGNARLIVR